VLLLAPLATAGAPAVPDRAAGPVARPAPAAATGSAAPSDTGYPAPVGFVNDRANVMDDDASARLEAFLDQVKRKTGVQFAVLTLRTTAPLDPIQYKTEAYQRWFHGNRTSLLLLVALDERRIAFETGYELEGILPDALEARIIREEMTPRFRSGDFAGGVTAAVLRVSAILAKDRGVTLEWDGRELRYRPSPRTGGAYPLAALVVVLVFAMLSRHQRTMWGGPRGRGRGRYGGGWIGPGSLGGWGGGSGGGGFGGFGGGGGFGSGGGGGGGSW
jgi:uncharacterized protein